MKKRLLFPALVLIASLLAFQNCGDVRIKGPDTPPPPVTPLVPGTPVSPPIEGEPPQQPPPAQPEEPVVGPCGEAICRDEGRAPDDQKAVDPGGSSFINSFGLGMTHIDYIAGAAVGQGSYFIGGFFYRDRNRPVLQNGLYVLGPNKVLHSLDPSIHIGVSGDSVPLLSETQYNTDHFTFSPLSADGSKVLVSWSGRHYSSPVVAEFNADRTGIQLGAVLKPFDEVAWKSGNPEWYGYAASNGDKILLSRMSADGMGSISNAQSSMAGSAFGTIGPRTLRADVLSPLAPLRNGFVGCGRESASRAWVAVRWGASGNIEEHTLPGTCSLPSVGVDSSPDLKQFAYSDLTTGKVYVYDWPQSGAPVVKSEPISHGCSDRAPRVSVAGDYLAIGCLNRREIRVYHKGVQVAEVALKSGTWAAKPGMDPGNTLKNGNPCWEGYADPLSFCDLNQPYPSAGLKDIELNDTDELKVSVGYPGALLHYKYRFEARP